MLQMETLKKSLMLSFLFFSFFLFIYLFIYFLQKRKIYSLGTKFMCKNELFQSLRMKNETHV
jgi:hypothetical protein